MGGDHGIPIPVFRALNSQGPITLIHIDAHLDWRDKVGLPEVVQVLKMPVVWLISIVILCAYSAYWGSFFFTPYASDVFLMSVTMAGVLSVGRMWLKPFAALAAGFLGDRYGIARSVAVSLAITAASFALFAVTPPNPAILPLVILNVAISATFIFALRGIYFALLEDGGIPLALTGTAAGIASAIGLIPGNCSSRFDSRCTLFECHDSVRNHLP